MVKKIYLFGNPLVEEDKTPFLIKNDLKKIFPAINFIETDPNENFPPPQEKNPVIIDCVIGIKQPLLLSLDDLDALKKTPVSPHDYDLLFHLLLLKKLKKIRSATIIGLPAIKSRKEAKKLVKALTNLIQTLTAI